MYHELNAGLQTLAIRSKIAKGLAFAVMVLFGLSSMLDLTRITGNDPLEGDGPVQFLVAAIYIGLSAAFLLSVIFVSMWIHRAHANLVAAGVQGLEFSPGWSVGWFFIPIANLFKPFQAMRELWRRSHGDQDRDLTGSTPRDVTIWWASYLAGYIAINVGERVEQFGASEAFTLGVVIGCMGMIGMAVSAWFLIRIINAVGIAQRSMMGIAEAFG